MYHHYPRHLQRGGQCFCHHCLMSCKVPHSSPSLDFCLTHCSPSLYPSTPCPVSSATPPLSAPLVSTSRTLISSTWPVTSISPSAGSALPPGAWPPSQPSPAPSMPV